MPDARPIELILTLGPTTPALGVCLGHQAIIEAFGGEIGQAKALLHYAKARRTGAPVEFAQYYNGHVMLVKAVPSGTLVTLWYEVVAMLDVLTLDGLRESLDSALAKLSAAEETIRREQVRTSLRLVGGRA